MVTALLCLAARMSGVFFADLFLPEPDVNLRVGSGAHAEQVLYFA